MKGLEENDYFYFALFFILSLIVMWNLLLPGYIITLDMVFVPNISKTVENLFYGFHNGFYNIAPLYFLIYLLSFAIPLWTIEKIILFSILLISGISAYKLCPSENRCGKLFAGILYMINPFTYVRFLAGHWHTLLGYAIAPLVIFSFINLFKNQTKKNIIKSAFWISLTGIFNAHYLFMILFVFLVFVVFRIAIKIKGHNKSGIVKIGKSVLCILGIFLILSIYWIVPFLTAEENILNQIDEGDMLFYRSQPDIAFNTIFNTLSMHGFWRGGYDYAKYHIPHWYLMFVFILFLSIYGYIESKSEYKPAFLVIAIASLVIAVGITSSYFKGMYEWLFENFFIFRGMREPHKFVGLLALFYSFFGGIGVGAFAKAWKKNQDKIGLAVVILALIIPFLYSYTMLFGFNGWLKPVDYPHDWYELNDFLNNDKDDFNILFLPWHMYMDFKWIQNSDKRIAVPRFFSKPMIKGDNVEIDFLYSQSANPISKYIEFLLKNGHEINNFGELVAPLNVKYILLTKEADWLNYLWLKNQTDLELVKDTENFLVFRNTNPTAKMYQVDEINKIRSWNELLNISKETDITSAIYVIGNETEIKESSRIYINYSKKSPINFELQSPVKRYVVFVERYSDAWVLNGEKPIKNLDTMIAFQAKEGNIRYAKFALYLSCYLASFIAFIIVLFIIKKICNSTFCK